MPSDILFDVGDNVPGIQYAWLADVDFLDSLPEPSQLLIASDVTFLSGGGWYPIAFIKQSGLLRVDQLEDRRGISYNVSISGDIAKDSSAIAQSLEYIKNRKLVILIQDKNQQYRLVGTEEYYLLQQNNFDSGASGGENNRTAISFTGFLLEPPPFYTGAISLAS